MKAPSIVFLGLLAVVVAALLVVWGPLSSRGEATRPDLSARAADRGTPAALEAESPEPADDREPPRESVPAPEGPGPADLDAPPVAPEASGPIEVVGRVLDAGGRTVSGVPVWRSGERNRDGLGVAVTDPDGVYRIPLLPGPNRLAAKGLTTRVARGDVDVPDGSDPVPGPTLVLEEGLELRGRVLGPAGEPRAGVRIRCYAEEGQVIEAFIAGQRVRFGQDDVLTDDEGRFVLRGLEDVGHRVELGFQFLQGLRAEPEGIDGARPGGEELVLRLVADAVLRGRVLDDETGEPLPVFTVDGKTVRDPDGRFEVPSGADLSHAFGARGYRGAGVEGAAETKEVEVRLRPDRNAGALVVRATDGEGRPVPGLHVRGVGLGGGGSWREGPSPEAGLLRAEGLVAGQHRVHVTAEGHVFADAQVEVPAAGEAELDLVLERGHPVHLTVVDAQERIQEDVELRLATEGGATPPDWNFEFDRAQATLIWISLHEVRGAERDGWLEVSEGLGTISGLPEGRYWIHVRAKGGEEVRRPFEVSASSRAELRVEV